MPSASSDIHRKLADLQAQIRELKARTVTRDAVSNLNVTGGSIEIDGGELVLKDVGGTILFRIGTQAFGDRGITISRSDGSKALQIAKIFGPGDTQQKLAFFDPSGGRIGGDAALSSSGFDSPHVPMVWHPVDRSDAKTTTSATFVSLFRHIGVRGNPATPISLSVLCSDGTTSGEVQVVDVNTGIGLAAFFASPWVGTVPLGTVTATLITAPPLGLPGQNGDAYTLEVQARRTAGAGTVSVAIASEVGGSF